MGSKETWNFLKREGNIYLVEGEVSPYLYKSVLVTPEGNRFLVDSVYRNSSTGLDNTNVELEALSPTANFPKVGPTFHFEVLESDKGKCPQCGLCYFRYAFPHWYFGPKEPGWSTSGGTTDWRSQRIWNVNSCDCGVQLPEPSETYLPDARRALLGLLAIQTGLNKKFTELMELWEKETEAKYTSDLNNPILTSTALQIIALGELAVPLLLQEIKFSPRLGPVLLLKEILGKEPLIPKEDQGIVGVICYHWLDFGYKLGYRY